MPLVRVDVVEGRTPKGLRALADAMQDVMRDVFAAPPGDRYQILTEHRPGHLVVEDSGLGFARTDELVVVQVTHQGRDRAQKERLYAELYRVLHERFGLAEGDLVVSVVRNEREDWSFGAGRAQFLTGEL